MILFSNLRVGFIRYKQRKMNIPANNSIHCCISMGCCSSLILNSVSGSILLVVIRKDVDLQEKINCLDLSRHIDYGEYIHHSSQNEAKSDRNDTEEEDELILYSIPQYIYAMKNLLKLDMSFQYIKEIPDEIALLENIRELRCSENKYLMVIEV